MGRWTPRVHARVVRGSGSTLELPGGVGWFQIVTNYSIFGGQRQSVSKLNNFFSILTATRSSKLVPGLLLLLLLLGFQVIQLLPSPKN